MTRARIVLAILAVLATACPTSSPVSEGPSPSGSPSLVSTGLAGRLVIVTKAPPSAMPLLDAIDEMNPDGSGERQLPIGDALCCENPALSPDGTRLLVTGEGTIGVSDVDGKNGASLAPGTSVGSYWAPTWSPSGTQVAFIYSPGSGRSSEIDVVDADGKGRRRVVQGPEVSPTGGLAWSPDGKEIAFVTSSGGIDAVTVSNGVPHPILPGKAAAPDAASIVSLTWAPGPDLLFEVAAPTNTAIEEVSPDGSGEHLVLPPNPEDISSNYSLPSWGPDGVHFAAIKDGRIVIATPDGGVERSIGPRGVRFVQWGGPSGPATPPLSGRYVAMGDSYSSGEGADFPHEPGCSAPVYQDPSGSPADTDRIDGAQIGGLVISCIAPSDAKGNLCHRSTSAYPHILLDDLGSAAAGLKLDFVACSGAHTDDFLHRYDDRTPPSEPARHEHERAQMEHLGPDVSLVTLTIGGNDLDFAGTAQDCVTAGLKPLGGSGSCFGHDEMLVCKLLDPPDRDCPGVSTSLRQTWIDLFRTIREKAPNARIEVLGYPRFFALGGDNGGCEHFTQLEERWIDDRIKLVDDTLQDAVGESGVANYVDEYDAFNGKEECTRNPDINGINIPGGIFGTPENLHPDPAGHTDEAAILAAQIRQQTGLVPATDTWTVAPGKSGTFLLHHPVGGHEETIAVAPSRAGKPVNVPVSITDPAGKAVDPVVATGTETVWDIPAAADTYTLHLDNMKSNVAVTAAVNAWVSRVPAVVRGAVIFPLGPNYCSGQSESNRCMDILIKQPPSSTPIVGYTLYGGEDPLQTLDTFHSATPRRIESITCLSDPVLQVQGATGTFSAWIGTDVLSCAESQGSSAVSSTAPAAGTSLEVGGTGFAPGAPVAAMLESTPVVLGTTTADSEGRARGEFTIPAGTSVGTHHVALVGLAPNRHVLRLLSPPIHVTAASGGIGALLLFGFGAGFIVIVGGFLLVRRRRRRISGVSARPS